VPGGVGGYKGDYRNVPPPGNTIYDREANKSVRKAENFAEGYEGLLNSHITRVKEEYRQADLNLETILYENREKKRGILNDDDRLLLKLAQEKREQSTRVLEDLKRRLKDFGPWRDKEIRKIESLRIRANNGDLKAQDKLTYDFPPLGPPLSPWTFPQPPLQPREPTPPGGYTPPAAR